jgi:hypothetical protein
MSSAELPDREPDVLIVGAGNAALMRMLRLNGNPRARSLLGTLGNLQPGSAIRLRAGPIPP